MGFPGISDNDDAVVRLLKKIAANTGSIEEEAGATVNKEVNIEGQTADGRVGLVPPRKYTVVETDNLDAANEDGTVTLSPGDSKTIVKYTNGSAALFALGAIDEPGVQYELRIDSNPVGGITNSPLGVLNNPFSFVNHIGGAIPSESRVEYVAHYDSGATGDVNMIGRLHLEVLE